MKDKFSPIGALLILLAGIALIWFHATLAVATIVMIVGIIFIVPGVINLIIYLVQNRETAADDQAIKEGQKPAQKHTATIFSWLSSIAGIILGLVMVIFTTQFVSLLAFVFGILLALCALFHFFVLAISYKRVDFSGWLYFMPIALVGLAIACFCLTPGKHDPILILLTGIGLCVFAVTIFLESAYNYRHRRHLRKQAEVEQAATEVKPVPEAADDTEKKDITTLPEE